MAMEWVDPPAPSELEPAIAAAFARTEQRIAWLTLVLGGATAMFVRPASDTPGSVASGAGSAAQPDRIAIANTAQTNLAFTAFACPKVGDRGSRSLCQRSS